MSKRIWKKSKRRSKAVLPALGMTGLSLSLASGASASTGEETHPATSQPHEIFLGEEEVFDTSLSTFFTFDKENGGANSLRSCRCRLRSCRCHKAKEREPEGWPLVITDDFF
jgi:hypothetical protein